MLTRTRKAFTLLELIVVIVILGVLALIAIPTFAKVIEKSREAAAERSAESIGRNALALAAFDDTRTVTAVTADTTDAADATYLSVAAAEAGATAAGSVVTTGDYKVTLAFDGAKVNAASVSK